ncbi:LuxR family transcriptional regulator [Thalassotalea sp. M1531]|uniref:LuxR family transcriptional regulator n=1 Tax=Thalassotalea algicola TaxID=2716224 RepID=A0A7Y0Q8W7_9GAMM|nr:helix-turn-helix transcriptional regulator [Thalassotalea algicola]NMP32585.1 LuxR family transcriptional regulator [Thalassotalea algicola]
MNTLSPDEFISQLYRKAPLIPLNEFANWALDLLRYTINFDGAIWGTGHISTRTFHTQTALDIPPDIFSKLINYSDINPIVEVLEENRGSAIRMRDVFEDEQFFNSTLYHKCFRPFGIERILSSIHLDERSGIFTVLSLYRFDRDHKFTSEEKEIQNRLLYHLLNCASHRQLIEIKGLSNGQERQDISALCDAQGIYHAVTLQFLDLLESHSANLTAQQFPIDFIDKGESFIEGKLKFDVKKYGELYKITAHVKNKFDELTARERQVIEGICQGRTFKHIARELSLSPSTVSNHLYRIYLKLGIHTRSELVDLNKEYVQ